MQERPQLHRRRGSPLSDRALSDKALSDRARAAANNAAWCDAVVRAGGGEGRFRPALWFSPSPAPRFYPNLVTLTADGMAAQMEGIRTVTAARGDSGWAVKDSFATLDLAPLGFRLLFEAEWLQRAPIETDTGGWTRIDNAAGLTEWVVAWSDGTPTGLFAPALLDDRRHAFLALRQQDHIVAGGVASLAAGVIGLSNLFGPEELWPGCLDAAAALSASLPLVTYAHGAEAAMLRALGFRSLGPLRVWGR